MSPKGRPTDDPKTCRFEIRISEADIDIVYNSLQRFAVLSCFFHRK